MRLLHLSPCASTLEITIDNPGSVSNPGIYRTSGRNPLNICDILLYRHTTAGPACYYIATVFRRCPGWNNPSAGSANDQGATPEIDIGETIRGQTSWPPSSCHWESATLGTWHWQRWRRHNVRPDPTCDWTKLVLGYKTNQTGIANADRGGAHSVCSFRHIDAEQCVDCAKRLHAGFRCLVRLHSAFGYSGNNRPDSDRHSIVCLLAARQ